MTHAHLRNADGEREGRCGAVRGGARERESARARERDEQAEGQEIKNDTQSFENTIN